jgi:hypothetical protein
VWRARAIIFSHQYLLQQSYWCRGLIEIRRLGKSSPVYSLICRRAGNIPEVADSVKIYFPVAEHFSACQNIDL